MGGSSFISDCRDIATVIVIFVILFIAVATMLSLMDDVPTGSVPADVVGE